MAVGLLPTIIRILFLFAWIIFFHFYSMRFCIILSLRATGMYFSDLVVIFGVSVYFAFAMVHFIYFF